MFIELRELLCSGVIRRHQPGSKGQKAVRVRMTRLLILESAKYEKFYHVSHAIYGQSVKNSILRRR